MIGARDIVKVINERLETTWTDYEWIHGKKIPIPSEWAGRLKFVSERYVQAGWAVRREAAISTGKGFIEYYFVFSHPSSFDKCPPELRGTGVK